MDEKNDSPKSIDMEELDALPFEQQKAKLLQALRLAEIKAQLYEEMIDVAESIFKIDIKNIEDQKGK